MGWKEERFCKFSSEVASIQIVLAAKWIPVRSYCWHWVSKQCLIVHVFCLFPRIHPGPLYMWAVITAEQGNVQEMTTLIHCQENFFPLRLSVVKRASMTRACLSCLLGSCGKAVMVISKMCLIWSLTSNLALCEQCVSDIQQCWL